MPIIWILLSVASSRAANEDARQKALQIATDAYTANIAALDAQQQQNMTLLANGIAAKLSDDPVGHLSGAFVSMLSQGANKNAVAALAAWEVQRFPDSAPLLNNFGYALFLLKDYDHATTILSQAVALDGQCAEYATNLGNAYLDMGRDDLAKATYETALKIDPDHETAWLGLSCYYMKSRQFKAAMDILCKRHGSGFMQTNRDKVQASLNAVNDSDKCDWVLDGDSLDVMAQKVAKIAETKPLSVTPIVETMSPDLAKQIAAEMGQLPLTVAAPAQPSVIDYSNAKEHYITSSAYRDVVPLPPSAPVLTPAQERLRGMSKEQLKELGNQYRANAQKMMAQVKALKIDPKDPASIQKALQIVQSMPDPYGILPTANQQLSPGKPGGSPASPVAMPAADTPGLVTSSNYQNYARNRVNFQRFCDKLFDGLLAFAKDLAASFTDDMNAIKLRQQKERDQAQGPASANLLSRQLRERNQLRDAYVQKFGAELNTLYQKYIKPGIEEMERCHSLFIKNFNDPELKKSEAFAMKTQLDKLLGAVATAPAPIDSYEPESTEAAAQIEKQIAAVKAGAPHAGEPIAPLKQYDLERKTILDWIYKDAKFSVSISVAKVTFQNNELTLGISDLMSQEYMALGVNLVDQSVSLTDAKGFEFNVGVGIKGDDGMGASATAGASQLAQGTKTTLYFDDNLNVVDAKTTTTQATDNLTGSVKVGDLDSGLGVKGTLTTSVAEGFSGLHGAVESSFEKGLVVAQATVSEDSAGVQAGLQAKEGSLSAKGTTGVTADAKGNLYSESAVQAAFDDSLGSPADKNIQKVRYTIISNNYKKQIFP